MADKTEITLGLQPGGEDVENNNFRTNDAYLGQIEREDVYDEGKKLNMQMTIVDVIHGTMKDNKAKIDPASSSATLSLVPATLIIADFRFTSHDTSRRFKHAQIELRFQGANDYQDWNPPEVFQIAPMGSLGLQKTEKQQENKSGASVNAGGTFVANVSGELDWSLTTTQTLYDEAKIEGVNTKRKRNIEPKNAAVWSMSENESIEKGIPSLLRTAILLKRKDDEDFYCYIKVDTKVNLRLPGWNPSVESREAGKGDTDHVLMSPRKVRTKLPVAGIEESRLDKVVLSKLMGVTTRESIALPLVATAMTDGQISNLTPEDTVHTSRESEQSAGIASKDTFPSSASKKAEKSLHIPGSALENAILDPLREIGIHPPQKVNDLVTNSEEIPLSGGLKVEEGSSVEETLRLLLHAVRKGVEVIAEANRIRLEAWPEEKSKK